MNTPIITFRQEITDFIAANERIQRILAQGEVLTADETGVVRLCAAELLANVPEPF
ncbi:MAG: hypothetical protein H8K03_21330 [Nitrospira sp.]